MKKIALSVLALSSIAYISNADAASSQEATKEIVENSISKSDREITLGAGVGTTGFTGEIGIRNRKASTRLGRHIGFRFNYNTFDDTFEDVDFDDTEFDEISVQTESKGALLDLYLFNETWLLRNIRFTGGYYWGDMNVNANATTDSMVVNVGGTDYTLDSGAAINSGIDYDLTGPYLGLGYQAEILFGLGLTIDAGIIMIDDGASDVTLSATGTVNGGIDVTSDPTFLSRLAQEEENLEEELPEDFYPVVRVGLSYTF